MKALEYLSQGRPQKALPLLRKICRRAPVYANLLNLAAAERACGNLHDASVALQKCVALEPNKPEVWNNAAQLATDRGDWSVAVKCFARAAQLAEESGLLSTPAFKNICLGFAQSLMRLGKLSDAWKLWEYGRLEVSWHTLPGVPVWSGEQVNHLLVICEGGYGDAFNFSRWLPQAAARAKTVSLLVWDNLSTFWDWEALGVSPEGISKGRRVMRGVIPLSQEVVPADYDACISWMSLPAVFEVQSPDDIPCHPGQCSRKLLKALDLRIGYCWHAEENSSIRTVRRLDPLTADAVAKTISEFGTVHSLVPVGQELHRLNRIRLPKYTNHLEKCSWYETAGLIANSLDMVVTVDTAVAHLAGLAGVPTLLLLPCRSDWKWFTERDSGPWYGPQFQYYRNVSPTKWNGAQLQQAICQFIEKERS